MHVPSSEEAAMSDQYDAMKQVRLLPELAQALRDLAEQSVMPVSVTTLANMAIDRGIVALKKEIALKPKAKSEK